MENRLSLLLAAHAFYASKENKDKNATRLAKLAVGIDKMVDDLVKDIHVETKQDKPNPTTNHNPAQPDHSAKGSLSDADKKKLEDEKKKLADDKAKKDKADAEKKKKEEELAEVLEEAVPFYPCQVLAKGAKFPKPVKGDAPRSFKAYRDEAAAKAAKVDTLYPDMDTLQLVFDEAWKMACECKSNKEIVVMCQKELKAFYPEMKADSDWYSKLVNPLVATVQFIKKAFGYKLDDPNVSVTRPDEKDMVLKSDSDCYVKTTEPKETKDDKSKKSMTTVQETSKKGKETPAKPAEVNDEESQENEEGDEEPELDLELDDEKPARDTTVPPPVSKFDDFNSFETLVFEKILEGARQATEVKDEASKKAIQADNREEVRNLIASNFEGEEWTIRTEDGKWNPKLIRYHNDFITEISANKAKWPSVKK